MIAAGMLLSAALAVPPGEMAVEHTQPGHSGQPVIRRFERREEDNGRRLAWDGYVRELDFLWSEYRRKGSTTRAWRDYKRAVGQAKRRYVFQDPYLVPVVE